MCITLACRLNTIDPANTDVNFPRLAYTCTDATYQREQKQKQSRIAGMEIQVFRNRKSSQTNANLHYSNYSYSGLIPNERALRFFYCVRLSSIGIDQFGIELSHDRTLSHKFFFGSILFDYRGNRNQSFSSIKFDRVRVSSSLVCL